MLIVTEQDRVDRPDVRDGERRTHGLGQRDLRQLVFAGFIEGGIGEQTKAGIFDENRGAADQSETWSSHDCFSICQTCAAAGRVTR